MESPLLQNQVVGGDTLFLGVLHEEMHSSHPFVEVINPILLIEILGSFLKSVLLQEKKFPANQI